MPKKNVLFAESNNTVKGGGQISLLELARSIDRTAFDLFAICAGGGELSQRLTDEGVTTDHVAFPPLKTLNVFAIVSSIAQIMAVLRHRKIDIVHSNDTRAHLYCGIAARLTGIPCVFHFRVSYVDGIWDRLLPLLATRVVAVSASVAKRFPHLDTTKRAIIYNAVDITKFKRRASALRRRLSIGEDAYVVGTVGRLDPEKGIDTFLKIMGGLHAAFADCHAIIAGQGRDDYRRYLETLRDELGITENVHFIGIFRDAADYYSSLNTYCLFSVNEGFNRSILEAMAVECPVVAAAVGGNTEAIEDGVTGFLVEPSNTERVVTILEHLAKKPEERRTLGAAARDAVAQRFSLEKQAREIESLYASVLATPASKTTRGRRHFIA